MDIKKKWQEFIEGQKEYVGEISEHQLAEFKYIRTRKAAINKLLEPLVDEMQELIAKESDVWDDIHEEHELSSGYNIRIDNTTGQLTAKKGK